MNNTLILKDCCTFQEGYVNPSQKISTYFGNDIRWLRASDLNEGYVYDTERKLSKEGFESAGKSAKMFPKDSIAISKSGTIGSLGILKNEMCGNRAVINIVVDQKKANLRYVFYTLKHKKSQIISRTGGSIQKNLYVSALETLSLNHSDVEDQSKISHVLFTLDEKIELNNQINAEFEDMAKTLYDYWFVQFDFPDINGQPYKSSGGKMVYNEVLKREIPEGWEQASLWDIAKYYNGLAMQKYRSTGDDYLPVIKIREMNNGVSPDTEKASIDIPSAAIIDDGDLLFSWSATLDIKIWSQGKGALNQHIFKVTSDIYPQSFYYFELMNYLSHFKMMADLRKTTMGHITLEHLKQANIVLPPIELIERLDEKLKPIFEHNLILKKENNRLVELRDWLLPMLMNGQVTVNQ